MLSGEGVVFPRTIIVLDSPLLYSIPHCWTGVSSLPFFPDPTSFLFLCNLGFLQMDVWSSYSQEIPKICQFIHHQRVKKKGHCLIPR